MIKPILVFSMIVILFIGLMPSQAFAQNPAVLYEIKRSSDTPNFVPGQVIVGLKQLDSSFNEKAKLLGGKVIDENNILKASLIQVSVNTEDAFINAIVKNPNVKFADKNFIVYPTSIPNDPKWDEQWNMKKIQVDDAWDIPLNNSDVVVAVADTGVDYNHPDLAGNIWMNPDEDCDNNVDDDGNGKIDDCRGWDFIFDDSDPMDIEGHGTHVAGTVAAATNNEVGVAGIAPVKIMPLKVLGEEGGSDWTVSEGIDYAIENGADVINLSLGVQCPIVFPGICYLPLTETAINRAYVSHDILVLAAAGNENKDADNHIPSYYLNAMAVAATDKDDKRASYSNFGDTVEISAPGGDLGTPYSETRILSTFIDDGYAYGAGTSMATPHVAGVAALMLSQNSSLTGPEIRDILKNTSVDVGDPGWDKETGEGRVNAYAAVNAVPPPEIFPTVPDVVGLSQAAAEAAIVAENLTVGTVTTANSDTVPAGDVISQSPIGGTEVAESSPVDIVVSLGTATDLSISVTTDSPSYSPKSFAVITVNVTDGQDPVDGASVSLTVTDPNGRDKTISGTTGIDGNVELKYRISPKAPSGTFVAEASVTAAGFDPANGSTMFTVG